MKIFLLTFVLVFFTVSVNAEVVKEKQKTEEEKEKAYNELLAEFFKATEELERVEAILVEEKKETKSAIEVNKKLDEIKEILSK